MNAAGKICEQIKYHRTRAKNPLFARGQEPGILDGVPRARCSATSRRISSAALCAALLVAWSAPALSDAKAPPPWVRKRPAAVTQQEKTVEARGANPCMTDDPGFGSYSTWSRAPAMGQMIVPNSLTKSATTFDVVFHFHGHEAARKEWVRSVDGVVLVGIDLGNGSGAYQQGFASPLVFEALLKSVERGVQEHVGNPKLRAGRVGLTAWSAGYGAVVRILDSNFGKHRVDAVALFDGLHTSYAYGALDTSRLEPVVSFAERAAQGEKVLYVSHSSIIPPGYASTTETSNYLIWRLGGLPEVPNTSRPFPLGLELISSFSRGDFTVRGFSGAGKLDHCAHFGILGEVVRGRFLTRWRARS
jgi:hypothetical protein